MTKQLLIYGKVIPVNKVKHADLSVKSGKNFEFARTVNSVPLMAVEFQAAAAEYAIVFAGSEEKVMPVVVLGVRAQENAYLNAAGEMQAKYVPAFLRRYPFVFSSADDGKKFTLCIDEGFEGCNTEGRGERLFDAEGEQTQYLQSILTFLKEYQAHFARTQAFCNKLQQLKLLEPMGAQITPIKGEQVTLSGFMAVNRERLKALSGEQLAELVKTDELELIYIHLQSMRNFTSIVERLPEAEAVAQPDLGQSEEMSAEPEESSSIN